MFFPIVVVLFLVLLLGVGVGTLIYAWYARQRGKLYYAIMIILFTLIYTCHLPTGSVKYMKIQMRPLFPIRDFCELDAGRNIIIIFITMNIIIK